MGAQERRRSVVVVCALGAVLSVAAGAAQAQTSLGLSARERTGTVLLTPAPYPRNMVDDVRRPGFNGRLWVTRPIIGGVDGHWASDTGSPGADAYGAYGQEGDAVPVRVPTFYRLGEQGRTVYLVSPWDRADDRPFAGDPYRNAFGNAEAEAFRAFEQARRQYLHEEGYTGGVRTFMNDLYVFGAAPSAGEQTGDAGGAPEPRGIIERPADQPAFQRRQRVEALPAFRVVEPAPRVAQEGEDARAESVSVQARAQADAIARAMLRRDAATAVRSVEDAPAGGPSARAGEGVGARGERAGSERAGG